MTELDKLIANAYASAGKQEDVNKVYLLLLRSLLYIPVKKEHTVDNEEPFSPLFTLIDNQYYMPTFDTLDRLKTWVGMHVNEIPYVELSGEDLIAGIHPSVFLCLNIGTDYYKEFSPDEVKHLKMIESRIRQMKEG